MLFRRMSGFLHFGQAFSAAAASLFFDGHSLLMQVSCFRRLDIMMIIGFPHTVHTFSDGTTFPASGRLKVSVHVGYRSQATNLPYFPFRTIRMPPHLGHLPTVFSWSLVSLSAASSSFPTSLSRFLNCDKQTRD